MVDDDAFICVSKEIKNRLVKVTGSYWGIYVDNSKDKRSLYPFTINVYSTPPLFQHACQKSMMILSLTSSILENSFIMDYFTCLDLCVSVITYKPTCIHQAM